MGIPNTLADLNDHLFAELERLGDESLAGDALSAEIERARAISGVAQQVVSNASTVLRACEMADMRGQGGQPRVHDEARAREGAREGRDGLRHRRVPPVVRARARGVRQTHVGCGRKGAMQRVGNRRDHAQGRCHRVGCQVNHWDKRSEGSVMPHERTQAMPLLRR